MHGFAETRRKLLQAMCPALLNEFNKLSAWLCNWLCFCARSSRLLD